MHPHCRLVGFLLFIVTVFPHIAMHVVQPQAVRLVAADHTRPFQSRLRRIEIRLARQQIVRRLVEVEVVEVLVDVLVLVVDVEVEVVEVV